MSSWDPPLTRAFDSATNRIKVDAAGTTAQGALTDRSGTIAAAATSQQIAAANGARRYLRVQNLDAVADLWVNLGAAANAGAGSLRLAPGAVLTFDGSFVPTQAVNVLGATAGAAFTAKEG